MFLSPFFAKIGFCSKIATDWFLNKSPVSHYTHFHQWKVSNSHCCGSIKYKCILRHCKNSVFKSSFVLHSNRESVCCYESGYRVNLFHWTIYYNFSATLKEGDINCGPGLTVSLMGNYVYMPVRKRSKHFVQYINKQYTGARKKPQQDRNLRSLLDI